VRSEGGLTHPGMGNHLPHDVTVDLRRTQTAPRGRATLVCGDRHSSARQAKASFIAVEFDEYGGGRGPLVHQQLFADLMEAAGLDPTYLAYLDDVAADALAAVNLMSLFGLHRVLRGAAIGHFASTEITSSPGS
jgi:hypothetical protein